MYRIIGTFHSWWHKKYFCVCVKWDAVIAVSPVKVSVCVPSPSQDSRRERSNNFQAFVKMALETLLGSCRRKHGGPRGKQGWEPLTFLLSPQTELLDDQIQHSICSPHCRESEPDLHPSPSVGQPLFFPSPSPNLFPPTVCSGVLNAQKYTPG